MTISNMDDVIDLRDITDRVEELREEREDWNEGHPATPWVSEHPADAEELATLESLLDELKGYGGDHDWEGDWYPGSLIRDTYFVKAMQELCEDIGDFPNGVPSYYVIDWEATARNLRADYSSVEFDGVTYWYR